MTQVVNVLKFLVLCLGNLLADLAQIEKLLPALALLFSFIAALTPATSPQGKLVAAIIAGISALALAIPAIVANGSQLVTDFELLWGKATGKAPVVPIPIAIPVLIATSPTAVVPSPLTDIPTAA